MFLGLKPKNSPRGLQLPWDVAPGLWGARAGSSCSKIWLTGWFDKELLENARGLESLLLLLPAGRWLGKVLTTAGKILFVFKLLIPGVCWVAAHGDGGRGATTTLRVGEKG